MVLGRARLPNLTYFLALQAPHFLALHAAHFLALHAAHFLALQAAHFFAAQAEHGLLAQVAAVRQRAPQPPLAQPARAEAVTTAVASARERLEASEFMVKSFGAWVEEMREKEERKGRQKTGQ
jgi:hypothetical protein